MWKVVRFSPTATMMRSHLPRVRMALVPMAASSFHLAWASWTSNTSISESVDYAPPGVTAGKVNSRRSMPVLAVHSFLLAALTVGFVIFRCFSALKSSTLKNDNGITIRRLAEFTGACCLVRCS